MCNEMIGVSSILAEINSYSRGSMKLTQTLLTREHVTRDIPKQKLEISLRMDLTLVKILLPDQEQKRKGETFRNVWVGK